MLSSSLLYLLYTSLYVIAGPPNLTLSSLVLSAAHSTSSTDLDSVHF